MGPRRGPDGPFSTGSFGPTPHVAPAQCGLQRIRSIEDEQLGSALPVIGRAGLGSTRDVSRPGPRRLVWSRDPARADTAVRAPDRAASMRGTARVTGNR